MTTENLLIWNVRGLNARARRNVVRDLAADQHVSLVCFQETKLDTCTDAIVRDLVGMNFDFFLTSSGAYLRRYSSCLESRYLVSRYSNLL